MKIAQRNDKKAFYGVPNGTDDVIFTRMRGFTEISISKNPTEYSRRYVDEQNERTDVTGYSSSVSLGFDEIVDDAVHADIVEITDSELIGDKAVREVVFVDFNKEESGGYKAFKYSFSVIADTEGGDTDAYTHSVTLKANGEPVKGLATIKTPVSGTSDTVEEITFEAE